MKSGKWKDLFSFSSREKRGLIVLVGILMILVVIRIWSPWDNSEDNIHDFSGYESDIDRFEMSLQATDNANKQSRYESGKSDNPDYSADLFAFDPNTVSRNEMVSLGFPDKVVQNIIKYRKAGGRFFEKNDLADIYGMQQKFYEHLKPYITFDDEHETKHELQTFRFNPNTITRDSLIMLGFDDDVAARWVKYRTASGGFESIEDIKKLYNVNQKRLDELQSFMVFPDVDTLVASSNQVTQEKGPLDINQASVYDLIQRNLTDSKLAGRIIAYRDLLGGYVKPEQLKEVYGMTPETVEELSKYLVFKKSGLKKMNLNTVDFGGLLRHPYLEKADVKNIFKYKNFTDSIASPDELIKNRILHDTVFQKISPYLSVE
jgi:DNA uptake protein ComE-like DNA-binding protein